MNIDIYSDRTKGFIQSAQTLAQIEGHQRLTPLHILKVLLDDKEGLCSNLIQKAGGRNILQDVVAELAKLPKISGNAAGQLYMDPELAKVFATAEETSKNFGDTFVTVEFLLLALLLTPGTKAHEILKSSGITPESLKATIGDLRKGRNATTAGAEDNYDALKKYASDMTEIASQG